MPKNIFIIAAVILLGGSIYFYYTEKTAPQSVEKAGKTATSTKDDVTPIAEMPVAEVIAENLTIPWDIIWLPDGSMLVSERPGRILHITKNGNRAEVPYDGVRHEGEGGLLGMALHPEFEKNHFLYIYLTAPDEKGFTKNHVERYRFEAGALADKKTIIQNIPGALYHDGGRIEFGPDGKLYIATGDATKSTLAQDKNSLAGKILRLNDDGTIPGDNPFGTAVYSYGHRNPQGLAWDSEGRLWSTEHGRSGVLSGFDEVNLIEPGKNYGWPTIEGDKTQVGMEIPVRHSGATTTWAPASAIILNGSLFFGGLRGEALYEAVLDGTGTKELKRHFYQEYGRIRTVRVGPDGMLYMATSNRDDRGKPQSGDDKIIRINPKKLE